MKIKKFNQVITPDAKCVINIELINNAIIIDNEQFLSTYKISKIFKGKYFIKRLIKKIFKYQLNTKLVWDNCFWEKISIIQSNTKINYINPNSYDDLYRELFNSTKSSRMSDIQKYKNLIISEVDLSHPLYISAGALNCLGADLNDSEVFILDGSRRLVASILANVNPNILLIDLKE